MVGSTYLRFVPDTAVAFSLMMISFWGMQVLTATGAVVNVLRIPEKWYHVKDPRVAGRFDYWMNSHQLMHVLVAGAMIHYSLGAACDYLHHMSQTQCPAWELMY